MGNTWKNILEHGKAAAGVVADKTSEVVDAAGKKAVQLKEEASIESQIHKLTKRLEECYMEAGEQAYSLRQQLPAGHSIQKIFDEIQQNIADILQLKEDLDAVNGVWTCPNCNERCDPDTKFCPQCATPNKPR